MSVEYTIVKRKFKDSEGNSQEKFYASGHISGVTNTKQIASLIGRSTTLNEADIYGALKALSQTIQSQLQQGKSVKLDGIGTFSLSLTSKPSNEADKLPHKSIKVNRICFKADRELSNEMKNLPVVKAVTSI